MFGQIPPIMKTFLISLMILAVVAPVSAELSKRELAKAVLLEIGVSNRFDAYLTRGADHVAGGDIRNPKLHKWLQDLWVEELGWMKVQEAYVSHFEAKFTEAELKELLELSKKPLMKKLLREELEAYRATFEQRNKTFATFWQRDNALVFSPPPDALS